MPKTHAEHIKIYGRQSKNIEDLRDRAVGPKGNKVRTKAAIKSGAIGRLTYKALDSDLTTTPKSLSSVDPNAPNADNSTRNRNIFVNNKRMQKPEQVGIRMLRAKINAPATSFANVKPKAETQFLKHKVVDN